MYSKMYFVFSRSIQFDIFIVSNIRILFTDVWTEILSKKPSGLPIRSAGINDGSLPRLPSITSNGLPTFSFPSRSISDSSSGK